MRASYIIATIGLTFLLGCSPFEPPIYKPCEEALKGRLRSPSSYKRIEITDSSRQMTRDDLLIELRDEEVGGEVRMNRINAFDNGNFKPVKYRLRITYDAVNAFNVPIRDTVTCEYTGMTGKTPSSLLVKIDGKTTAEWLVAR